MYWFDYWLGARVLDQQLTYEELQTILHYHGWVGLKHAFWMVCVELAGPMWLGGLVLAIAHAVPGYYVTRWAVRRFRRRQTGSYSGASSAHGGAATSVSPFSTPASMGDQS
jgi:uncharacterized protein (DUF2062 family)